ncbi:MAG TPA: hypothetical protein VGM06_26405 [Polyangiaceae bacterium]
MGPRPGPADGPEAEATEDTEILDREPGKFCFARWKNVVMQAWAAQADAADLARLRQTLTRGGGFGIRSSITIVADRLPPPTEAARLAFIELVNNGAKEIVCLAIIVHGTGFASSALRSSITSIRIATGRAFEMTVLASVDELGPWLPPRHVERTGVEIDAVRLCDVVRHVERVAASSAPMLSRPPRDG